MDIFLDILKFTIPALVVFLTTVFLVKKFLEKDYNQKMLDLKMKSSDKSYSVKVQAYERLALYLERINLNNSVMSHYKPGMSARLLQTELLTQIRREYDHNMAQQIYVTGPTWEMLKSAKEETIKLINIAAQQAGKDANGVELSTKIFELTAQLEEGPSDIALKQLKHDVKKLF